MKVNGITSYTVNSAPAFGRKLKEEEKEPCAKAIREGLKTLDKNLTLILPTNCAPGEKSKDIGTGQPYTESSKMMAAPFMQQWGFSRWQQEPNYLRKQTDPSPYVSNTTAYNTLMIDFEALTKEENACLLPKMSYDYIISHTPKPGSDRADFTYATRAADRVVYETYDSYAYKMKHIEDLTFEEIGAILQYDEDFHKFVEENGEKQEKNALYAILTDEHNNDYWPNWKSEVDKNLFGKPKNSKEAKAQKARLEELRTKHEKQINTYLFGQMLAKQAMEKGSKEYEKRGIKQSADIPVACSDAEVWGNRALFSENLRMGCKEPDNWNTPTQYWGFPVLDPEQMFNEDGSLGKAGQFLYDKYERAFKENKGGVRIDHIVGLMDPYVYDVNDKSKGGRLYSELYKGVNGDPEKCDRILKEIVLPAAEAAGVKPSDIIAEDLGYMPNKTKQALNDLGISGISVTQWMDSHSVWNAPKNNAIMVAGHDTPTAKELYPDNNERRNKFIELFSSGAKNIQIFWTDLFGIKERYNQPGTVSKENWSLRMTPDFDDKYYKKLPTDDALNIPEVVLEANRRRNDNFVHQHKKLADDLQHWTNVLKEPE